MKRLSQANRRRHFTLVEMVVAMAVLVVVALILGTASAAFYNGYQRSVRVTERLKTCQTIDRVMDRLVRNLVPFEWEDELNSTRLVFEGEPDSLHFVTLQRTYGSDRGEVSFPQLLRRICAREEKFRLRFMTSNPKDFGEDLVRAIADHRQLCRLVHLPVQAGSDRILRLMNRKYTAKEYLQKVEMLRRILPDCRLSTDIMVGFPTETEEDFRATLDLVRAADFSTAFTFVYSRRSGTAAAQMEGQIPEEVQKERIMRLVELVNAQTREQSLAYRGKTVEILCEDRDEKKGLYLGRDEFGRMGYFASERDCIGEFVQMRVTDSSGISLMGEVAAKE